MRRARALVLSGLLVFAASSSGAAVLPASGTYAFQLATLPAIVLSGSGSASSVGGPGTGHTIPAAFLSLALPVTVAIQPTFTGLDSFNVPSGVQNGAGAFSPNGAMPLIGSVAFFAKNGTPAGGVPLAPIGGGATAMFAVGPLAGTLLGATFMGAGSGPPAVFQLATGALAIPITVTATAYDNRTAGGEGVVQLVAPATGSLGIFGALPVFGIVQIEYTPEPGTLVLLAAGLAALGVGVRRSRGR